MKKLLLLTLLFSAVFASQAQETAFEQYYPFYSWYSIHCIKETPDGGYIAYLGTDDGMLYKLSGSGEIIGQRLFDFGEPGITTVETYIYALLDKPGDPTHWTVFATTRDIDLNTSSSVYLFDIDENLGYEPENVRRIDFPSEEIQLWNNGYTPRIVMEEDGSVSGVSRALRWHKRAYSLMMFRIPPDGEVVMGIDDHFPMAHPTDWIPFDDRYGMVAAMESCLVYFEASLDLAHVDSVYTLTTGGGADTPLQYHTSAHPDMEHDTVVMAIQEQDSYSTLTFLSDSVMVLPTALSVFREYHSQPSIHRKGVGLWKLDPDFNHIGHTAVCGFTIDHLDKYLYSCHPLLLGDGALYLCYTEKPQGSAQLPWRTVVCKLDTDLNLIWQRWYGNGGYAKITECSLTSDGGCILIGEGRDNGSYCPYVVKITPEGYSAIDEEAGAELRPYAFYPNPVGDILHMEFSPDVKPVQVELYDLQGRLLRTQNNGFESIDMDNLPTGTYTLRVTLDDGMSYGDKVVKQ